jgi:hypothetical protein
MIDVKPQIELNRLGEFFLGQRMRIDAELQKDMQHKMWSITLNGKLHLASIGPTPENVLDIGTGTGVWAIEFGMLHDFFFS